MNLAPLFEFVERLRKEAIGDPIWIAEKEVFEYQEHSAKVVAVLKLVRAAQGVATLDVLCQHGLFIDLGVTIRCVDDCAAEVGFLLENFPKTFSTVDQFVRSFFKSTIDGYLSDDTPAVPSKKIRSAMVRILKGGPDHGIHELMSRIYRTFSGYVHANYAHIMEIYNGGIHEFMLTGVPSIGERHKRMAHVELAAQSVLFAAEFAAHKFGLNALYLDIAESRRA